MAFNNLLLNKQIPRKEQHITAKSYLDLQLQVDKDQTNRTKLNPAAHIDPSQFDLYSGLLFDKELACEIVKVLKKEQIISTFIR